MEFGMPTITLSNGRRIQVPTHLVEIRLGRGRREDGELRIPVHARIMRLPFLRWYLRTVYEVAPTLGRHGWSPVLWARVLWQCFRLAVTR